MGWGGVIILRKLILGFSFLTRDVDGRAEAEIISEALRDGQGCTARRQQVVTRTNEWGHHDR